MNNIMIMDRARYNSLMSNNRHLSAMMMLDLFLIKEEDGMYTVMKSRYSDFGPNKQVDRITVMEFLCLNQ